MFIRHLFAFEKCLFRSFAHFLIELFVFLVLSCMNCLYILEIKPLLMISFAIIFSHSEGCLLTLCIVFFADLAQYVISSFNSFQTMEGVWNTLTPFIIFLIYMLLFIIYFNSLFILTPVKHYYQCCFM